MFAAAAAAALVLGGCSRGPEEETSPPQAATAEAPAPAAAPTRTEAGEPSLPRLDLPAAEGVQVPPGFRAEVYATGLEQPTAMAFGPDGWLYVTQNVGTVVRVRPGAESPDLVAAGFEVPLGLAWRGRDLYVSSMGRLDRLRIERGRAAGREAILTGLPFGLHQQDNVVLGPDDRLYVGSGSTCDVCVEADPRSATVLTVEPDGSDLRVFSTGVRNPFGLAFQPGTGKLFVSVNGQDNLPDRNGPEPAEIVVVAKQGRDFGWPDCWPSIRERRLKGECAGVTPPVAYLEQHSSANGLAFYDGDSFPVEYGGNLFVALWGQYDSRAHGRRVERIVLGEDGKARSVEPFVRGFPHPLALAVDRRGALLVADWELGTIVRIQARGGP